MCVVNAYGHATINLIMRALHAAQSGYTFFQDLQILFKTASYPFTVEYAMTYSTNLFKFLLPSYQLFICLSN